MNLHTMPWPFFAAFVLFGSVAILGGLCLLLRWAISEWPGDVDDPHDYWADDARDPTKE